MKLLLCLISAVVLAAPVFSAAPLMPGKPAPARESLPEGAQVASLEITPSALKLSGCYDGAQLIVTATLANGDRADVTRLVTFSVADRVGEVKRLRMSAASTDPRRR